MKPTDRKRLFGYLQESSAIRQRRACRLVSISRKAMRYIAQRPLKDALIVDRLKELGEQYPRYTYLMLHAFLRREELIINKSVNSSPLHSKAIVWV